MAGCFTLLMGRDSVSTGQLTITGALLGGALGTTYAVWMASYSEDTEDVPRPASSVAYNVDVIVNL